MRNDDRPGEFAQKKIDGVQQGSAAARTLLSDPVNGHCLIVELSQAADVGASRRRKIDASVAHCDPTGLQHMRAACEAVQFEVERHQRRFQNGRI